MDIKQKHGLLNFVFDIECRGVKVSIDYSVNEIVVITIWANTEDHEIDYQKMFYSDSDIEKGIQEIETFLYERESLKPITEVA